VGQCWRQLINQGGVKSRPLFFEEKNMIIKVYDLEGNEHEKESVDARECCAEMGWSLTAPVVVADAPVVTEEKKKGKK
jgi:DNA-binding transcriptional regulator LsrR (DeoR family)